MAKKKAKKEVVVEVEETVEIPVEPIRVNVVAPLTEAFGNGDLNTLRDKINEIATHLNS